MATTNNEQENIEHSNKILTNAVLNITYDGSHFHGWSAANDNMQPDNDEIEEDVHISQNGADFLPPLNINKRGRRRKRGKRIPGITKIRSVEGVLKKCLAKVYGNVDPDRVQVEGCSRTDKGVHARSMIAQVYCLSGEAAMLLDEVKNKDEEKLVSKVDGQLDDNKKADHTNKNTNGSIPSSIPGKRVPHPFTSTDTTSFIPLPFDSNLGKMMFVLNRMLPPDVRVSAVSETPAKNSSIGESDGELASMPFHPSLDTVDKTYLYTFSIGDMHDPMRWRHVWHVENNGKNFDVSLAYRAAEVLVGKHDYMAFRGAFRGSERGRIQDTVCTLSEIKIKEEGNNNAIDGITLPLPEYSVGGRGEGCDEIKPLITYTISVTGDRFLYKMVRFLVGTIVAVGHGKIDIDDVKYALEHGSWDNGKEGTKGKKQHICAPAHGLVLKHVQYDDSIDFHWMGSNRWSALSRQEKHSWAS